MNLSDKNKKILEEELNCTIEFDREFNDSEMYKIKGSNIIFEIGYDKKEKYYFITNNNLNKLINCDKIVIIKDGFWSFGFMFVDDFENIKYDQRRKNKYIK